MLRPVFLVTALVVIQLLLVTPISATANTGKCRWVNGKMVGCTFSKAPRKEQRSRQGNTKPTNDRSKSNPSPVKQCFNTNAAIQCVEVTLPGKGPAEAPPPPPPSPTFMETQFKKYSIRPSVINSLPGDSWGIAHRKTAFWADSSIQYISDTILGYPITVKAIPRKYHWNFGDGNTLHTKHPGNKPTDINKARIYNVYTAPGNITVKLATTYSGMYKIGDSPWITIPGTTDIQSSNADLRIYRFHKYLVNKSCKEDPTGPDCAP